jgi:pimeloyl-ACP methyl ester carboxylesterase
MPRVRSRDGTEIAFDQLGGGPALILTVGAFNERSTGIPLATFLAPHFSVFAYDRRGRGESSDTLPYAVDREVEDLAAVIEAAGGSAAVFGYSSGAALALRAAAYGLPITRLVLYEAPFRPKGALIPNEPDHVKHLSALIAANRRGDAVEYYQSKLVGIPETIVVQMRSAPFRPALERLAPTLVYDATIMGDGSMPTELVARVTMPALALAGGASAPFMQAAATALAEALPHGRAEIVAGQTHDIVPSAIGPLMTQFLKE